MNRFIEVGKKLLCLASAATTAFGLVAMPRACAEQTTAQPIKIGLVVSLTGLGSIAGRQMLDGINLFLDGCDHKIAGREVQLITEDDASSPKTAVIKVRRLIDQEHVDLISGFYFTSVAYAAAPVADAEHIPCIIAVAGADDLTQRKSKHWVIRTSSTASQSCHPFGEYAAKILKYKKIITIASDYGYGHETVGGFQTAFEQNGGQIIQKLWISLDSKDYSSVFKQMRKDADAVFVAPVGKSAEVFPSQYTKLGPNLPVLAPNTAFDESSLAKTGPSLLGNISANAYSSALDSPVNKRFVQQYQAKYGEDPGFFADCGYTAGMWIKKGVESLKGSTRDKEKLMAALRKVELTDAPRGPIKLDEYGNPIENVYIRRVDLIKGGKYKNTVVYTYPHVSQFWNTTATDYLAKPVYSKVYPPCTHCK